MQRSVGVLLTLICLSSLLKATSYSIFSPVKCLAPASQASRVYSSPLFARPKGKKGSNSKRSLDIDDVADDEALDLANDEVFSKAFTQSLDKIKNLHVKLDEDDIQTLPKKSSIKSIATSIGDASSASPIVGTKREQIEAIIAKVVTDLNVTLIKQRFVQNRIEITVSNGAYNTEGMTELSAEGLRQVHSSLYAEFELREAELPVVTEYEVRNITFTPTTTTTTTITLMTDYMHILDISVHTWLE